MDVATIPDRKRGIRSLVFRAKVALNLHKDPDRKGIVGDPSETMTRSTQPPQPLQATISLKPPDTSEQQQEHPTQSQGPSQQISIEIDSNERRSSEPLIPIIEIDMTPADTVTIDHSSRDIILDPKSDAYRRYRSARAVFEKYGVPFDEDSWQVHPKVQGERINKAPRMRVRYTCHQCKQIFGHEKICIQCTHERCKKCIRYPPKRKKSKILRDPDAASPSPATENPQIVSGVCHECQTAFMVGITVCSNCQHQICGRCLQELVPTTEQQPLPDLLHITRLDIAEDAIS